MWSDSYEAVIGLEVHAQLATNTKIFCGCKTDFGGSPNSNVCPVCLAHPGVLPVLNKTAVEYIIKMGLAAECSIAPHSVFARKNYFYPDLPKGYQISQFEEPFCSGGYISVTKKDGTVKKIDITRIHLEEDAGKSIHDQSFDTQVDLNRSGVPLIEIVSEPVISDAEEAVLYLSAIRQIVQYLGICDGNMEEGSLRCDANISLRKKGVKTLGIKTEVKNMNSFKNVEKAIEFEINRQYEMLDDGKEVVQQTMLWDADTNSATPMRTKEDSHDYRYFPDPDLVPVTISIEWLHEIKSTMPELPAQRKNRFVSEYGLPVYDAEILTQSRDIADYFEGVLKTTSEYKQASNWVMGEVLKVLNEQKTLVTAFKVTPAELGNLINFIKTGTISNKIAKEVFSEMLVSGQNAKAIIEKGNYQQISDTGELEKIINSVLAASPAQVEEYKSGKEKVFGFFVGQIMKQTKGTANPGIVHELLKKILNG